MPEQLESAIETKADERMIKEMMEQMGSKLMECMISAERKIQPSARAQSHLWSPKMVVIQKKAGLLKNLLMVAKNISHQGRNACLISM